MDHDPNFKRLPLDDQQFHFWAESQSRYQATLRANIQITPQCFAEAEAVVKEHPQPLRNRPLVDISALDLELRGPGGIFGTRQAGMPSFRIANIIRDAPLQELAKSEAAGVLAGPNAEISAEEISRALVEMRARWQHTYGLVEVG